jgi:RNA polymerase sigma factor (sigma-70 family)
VHRAALERAGEEAWNERAGRLFAEFERPARAMVRRAFRGAFSDDEVEDIYASAWVGTLRSLAGRDRALSDGEVRSYLLTAVANQASKELRRRRRKPTAPLELVHAVPDEGESPDERASSSERSQVARDLLVSLPPRRRAVMLLRYGWGLEPGQVCKLIEGLSRRAYRKEITRGVEELTARMRALERGEWCADREEVLRAYAAGIADVEEQRQARAHLAHCRDCTDFVARLGRHLHDLGSAGAIGGAVDGLDGHVSIADRLADLGERSRELAGGVVGRGGSGGADEAASQVAATGGLRGAGAAGAGLLAKLAGLGAAGKVAVACVGAAAVVPCVNVLTGDDRDGSARVAAERERDRPAERRQIAPEVLPTQVAEQEGSGQAPEIAPAPEPRPQPSEASQPSEAPPPSEPVPAEEAPSSDFAFGAESASASPAPAPTPAPTTPASGGGSDSGGGGAPQGGDFAFGSQ